MLTLTDANAWVVVFGVILSVGVLGFAIDEIRDRRAWKRGR